MTTEGGTPVSLKDPVWYSSKADVLGHFEHPRFGPRSGTREIIQPRSQCLSTLRALEIGRGCVNSGPSIANSFYVVVKFVKGTFSGPCVDAKGGEDFDERVADGATSPFGAGGFGVLLVVQFSEEIDPVRTHNQSLVHNGALPKRR